MHSVCGNRRMVSEKLELRLLSSYAQIGSHSCADTHITRRLKGIILTRRRTLPWEHLDFADNGRQASRPCLHLKRHCAAAVVRHGDRQSQFEQVRSQTERLSTAVQRPLDVISSQREADEFDEERRLSGEHEFQT